MFADVIFEDVFLPSIQKALAMILRLAAPMLGAAIATGVAVSIFQATTKIQEQTLSFVPKIAATFLALVICVPGVKTECQEFLIEILGYIADLHIDSVI